MPGNYLPTVTQPAVGETAGTIPLASGALSDAWMERRAAEHGCDVLDAADDELQLDIDTDAAFGRFHRALALLQSAGASDPRTKVTEGEYCVMRSRSGGRHVVVQLTRALAVAERIALQAALGSDPDREMLSLLGAWAGKRRPVVLFRPAQEDGE